MGSVVARNQRVYEIAMRHGADQAVVLHLLKGLGEYVKGPSATLVPPVARKLAAALTAEGYFAPALPKLDSEPPTLRDLPGSASSVLHALGDGEHEVNRRIRLATEDRAVYYLSGPDAEDIVKSAAGAEPAVLSPAQLHTRTGVLIVQPESTEVAVYAWVADDDALRFQTLRLTESSDNSALTPSRIRSLDVPMADGLYTSDMNQFAEFCAVWDLVPNHEPRLASVPSSGTPAERRANSPITNDAPRISALTRPRDTEMRRSSGSRDRRPATHRWTVSGHYREQPYPSLGITKRIWIATHTSGAHEGELIDRLRVFVIAPR